MRIAAIKAYLRSRRKHSDFAALAINPTQGGAAALQSIDGGKMSLFAS
ncbi:hypothetical protein GTP41_03465 [Pseudoduganella sp. DS3]|uniref:Uncharacterized protein n=1 Tax=Pseudoduganella guangdongensis TaxID=2692179 RepID=A0A6N9HC65_9BURK|nr:hypothetical protein [Pseudoduganella guangdongensis]MYN01151.1 hypothetical protein [Pseudoduganella guangdongensis]